MVKLNDSGHVTAEDCAPRIFEWLITNSMPYPASAMVDLDIVRTDDEFTYARIPYRRKQSWRN